MTPGELIRFPAQVDARELAVMAVRRYHSDSTRRVYQNAIERFIRTGEPLSRDGVLDYLNSAGMTRDVRNCALTAIKAFATESEAQGMLTAVELERIRSIKLERISGRRAGNWLTLDEARTLYALPDRSTPKGMRDAAVMALLLGCALRRNEAVTVTWKHYRLLDGRMALVDLRGKGGKVRTVPVPEYAQADLDLWESWLRGANPLRVSDDWPILQSVSTRGRRITQGAHRQERHDIPSAVLCVPLAPTYLAMLLDKYGEQAGIGLVGKRKVRPHDLRRTQAQLMRKAGVELEQIQATLGHSSLQVTERYLGSAIKMGRGEAGVDKVSMTDMTKERKQGQ